MQVTEAGFAWMTRVLVEAAEACCPGRLVFVLEGGYDLAALASGVAAVLRTLLGEEPAAPEERRADRSTQAVIAGLRMRLAPRWPTLEAAV
jgi:acetoin utilization deacetylase AcuC-like enzyme